MSWRKVSPWGVSDRWAWSIFSCWAWLVLSCGSARALVVASSRASRVSCHATGSEFCESLISCPAICLLQRASGPQQWIVALPGLVASSLLVQGELGRIGRLCRRAWICRGWGCSSLVVLGFEVGLAILMGLFLGLAWGTFENLDWIDLFYLLGNFVGNSWLINNMVDLVVLNNLLTL